MVLGPHPQSFWEEFCNWTLLHESDGAPSRIFFDIAPSGIHKLGFESPPPGGETSLPTLPTPLSSYPESTSLDDYFYTSAPLENIVEITLCDGTILGRRSIIGLLFRYSDGTRTCVGQFRTDRPTMRLAVNKSTKMWLSFDTEDGYPFVDSVGVCRSPKPMSRTCLYISWVGRLEWWFSYKQCKVYYQGQESISTKS